MLSVAPLFSLSRGSHEEVCVLGELVYASGSGRVHRSAEAGARFPARSLLKPFQFLATGLRAREGDLPVERIAALGSISATTAQVEALRRWHSAEGRSEALLEHLCLPGAWPLCQQSRQHALAAGTGPAAVYHPCFSKHLAILAACRAHGWRLDGYTEASHPYHQRLLAVLEPLLGRPGEPLEFVTDGCQLCTPLLEALELARLYRELASAPEASELGQLGRAMADHPEWIGGPERVDTLLMQRNPGRLIAKEGADGLLAIGIAPSPIEPRGAGLVVKLAAGHQPAWAALAAAPFLSALGLEPLREPLPGQEVEWHVSPGRASRGAIDISPTLSERIAVWPGDTAFRRMPVSEPGAAGTGPTWDLLVSSIHTTLHVGAHADAPNHFQVGAVGIDRVPLAAYRGPCEVVEVAVPRGAMIAPRDLGRPPRAPRVLFKTGSFPDPERFDADFVAFSPELVEWLSALGAILIGIDTPSVDPFSSKALPSHHATRAGHGLAILEGLELSGVRPGLYELVALPLRIEGADASPVRATLWPLR